MTTIYILKLKNNKYYVGRTTNPDFRLAQHFQSGGSAWTRKYPPKSIHHVYHDCDSYDEDKYTKKYMGRYGIDNVRGGSYCTIKLSKEQQQHLDHEILGSTDRCYSCGEDDHFVNACPYDGQGPIDINCEVCNAQVNLFTVDFLVDDTKELRCVRCAATYTTDGLDRYNENIAKKRGKEQIADTHMSSEEIWCCSYCHEEFTNKKAADYHEKYHCDIAIINERSVDRYERGELDRCASILFGGKKNYQNALNTLEHSYHKSIKCYRCGRSGHYASTCYASTCYASTC